MVNKRQINSCHKVPIHALLLAEMTGLLLSRWGAGSDPGELELRDGQKEPPDKANNTERAIGCRICNLMGGRFM
jgi:hypothetical protein